MSNFIEPGAFHLFYGPMKSGKTGALINYLDFLRFTEGINFSFFKPATDTRDKEIKSRNSSQVYKAISIDPQKPEDILTHCKAHDIVAIDEIQFFSPSITEVIVELQKKKVHVVAAGLNLDFRGESFGPMGTLLSLATNPTFLTAVCEEKGCNHKATRTQRLIDGKPASYSEPLVSIEGNKGIESYEARCLHHHEVPK